MMQFLWSRNKGHKKYHLVNSEAITKEKDARGWAILYLNNFGWALLTKSLWRVIFGRGIWQDIIVGKYLKGRAFLDWYKRGLIGVSKGSYI